MKYTGFAIEMVAAAETVTSPMDGEPLNIRVGMHSGKIMAGVGELVASAAGKITAQCFPQAIALSNIGLTQSVWPSFVHM